MLKITDSESINALLASSYQQPSNEASSWRQRYSTLYQASAIKQAMGIGAPGSDPRPPLGPTTNEIDTPTPPPLSGTAKTGPILRHKVTHQALNPHLDSSESYPSPHSSIYEASLIHNSASEDVFDGWDSFPSITANEDNPPSWLNIILDSSGNPVPVSFLNQPSPKKTHTPHLLYPITEQNSLATLRPSFSIKSHLSTHISNRTLRPQSPGLAGKKRKSFSVSDLPVAPSSNDPAPSPPPSPLPKPIQPHQAPPTRIPTPPGLPTFNKPETSSYRLPPPPVRFRDKFRSPTAAEREWLRQTVGLPKGVVMRGDDGVMVKGRFTPIRSGHLPPQRQLHGVYRTPGQRRASSAGLAMLGAQDEPARVVQLGPRNGQAQIEEGVGNEERRVRGERAKKCLKCVFWVLFCCGLCEEWDLAAANDHGIQRVVVRGGKGGRRVGARWGYV